MQQINLIIVSFFTQIRLLSHKMIFTEWDFRGIEYIDMKKKKRVHLIQHLIITNPGLTYIFAEKIYFYIYMYIFFDI